jgi:hypothetical protein
MPKQRLQVDSGISAPALKPAASPVETFVQPNAGKQVEQLAQGLATLAPSLGHLSDVLSQRKSEADFSAGQQKARELAQNAKDFKEAIRQGKITPNQSPWFMAGLREQFGRLAADRMNFEMLSAAAQDDTLQSSVNPADFDSFVQKFTQQWQHDNLNEGDRDLHFEQGFGSKADAYVADAQRQFAAQLAGRVVKFAGDGHFSEVINNVMTEWGRHTSPEQIGAGITDLNDAAIARGMSGDLVNQMTVDAVIAVAKRTNDSSLLGLLDHIRSGKQDSKGNRPVLSTTRYGAAQMDDAENQIAADNQAANNRAYETQQRTKDRAAEGIIGNAVSMLENSRDPHSLDLKALRDQMASVAPEKVNMLYQLQDAWSDRTLSDEPLQVASAFRRIYTQNEGEHATSIEEAAAMLAHRQITIPTYQTLVNEIQQRDAQGQSPIERDPLFKAGQRQMRTMFVSEFGFDKPAMRQRAEEAVDEFSMRYIRWRSGPGKEATDPEIRQFIHDTRLEVFRAKSGVMEVRDFNDIPQANMGPQAPDPAKMLVTDPSNVTMLDSELQDLIGGKRNGFSPQALSVLQYIGIPPTLNAVQHFIQQQRKFVPTFVAPDSTQN